MFGFHREFVYWSAIQLRVANGNNSRVDISHVTITHAGIALDVELVSPSARWPARMTISDLVVRNCTIGMNSIVRLFGYGDYAERGADYRFPLKIHHTNFVVFTRCVFEHNDGGVLGGVIALRSVCC